jgi:glycine/D-amino acid oxidase-like deaminating enzyme
MTRLVVVGAGIFGLSTAWAAMRAGAEVEILEAAAALPNPVGSSVDQHRLIRHPYGAQAGYTRMVVDAYAAWDRLWADLGAVHYAHSGSLIVESAPAGWIAPCRSALDANGIAHRRPDAADFACDWPALIADGIHDALACDTGGTLFAADIVRDLAAWLSAKGARIRTGAAVREIDPGRADATLADGTVVSGDALVVCAGPWTNRLVPDMARRMTPSRQTIVYLEPPSDLAAVWARMPLLLDLAAEDVFYLCPPRAGRGLKVGFHNFSCTGDPDEPRDADPADAVKLVAACARRIARLSEYRVVTARNCFYDTVADERFVVEAVGPTSFVATGFSGHGFKFGAVVGERIVAAALGNLAPDALARWAAGHEHRA